MTNPTPQDLILLTSAAESAGVHVRTLYSWRDKGELRIFLRRAETDRGMREVAHVSASEFDAVMEERNRVRPATSPEGN